MTRWFWWIVAVAFVTASGQAGVRAGSGPAQTAAAPCTSPATAGSCCKCLDPSSSFMVHFFGASPAAAGSCCKDCCEKDSASCCKDGCKKDCACSCKDCCKKNGTGCCKDGCKKDCACSCKGCCKKDGALKGCVTGCCTGNHAGSKTRTVKTPVVIIRMTDHPSCPTASPYMPPPHAAVVMPPVPMPCPPGYSPCHAIPYSAPALMPAGRESRSYRIALKTVEAGPGADDLVASCPRVMVSEGAQYVLTFENEAVLGQCGRPRPSQYLPCCSKVAYHTGKPGGVVKVQVSGEKDGQVHLDLDVQQTEMSKAGKDGVQVMSKCLHVTRPVKLGKTTRVVLDRDPDGAPRRWLEVKVKKDSAGVVHACTEPQARSPELLPAPRKDEVEPGSFLSAVFEFAGDLLAECFGCPAETAAETIPADHYLQHPPQYFPPSPAFPEVIAAPPAPPVRAARTVPCQPVMQCNQPSVWATAVQPCAATVPAHTPPTIHVCVDDESRLEIACGCGIRFACKRMDLKMEHAESMTLGVADGQVMIKGAQVQARANAVTTDQKETLVLEGHVRMHYTKDGQSAEVTAERIEVSLRDGSLKIKGALKINP